MGQILTSIHGNLLGLDKDGNLVDRNGNPVGQKINTEGKVIYVSSVTGAANASGGSPQEAVTTLALGMAKATANQGDVVVLLPNHQETIGNESISLAVAGVYILGLGKGDTQPQFNHNHANAEISVAANDITIDNLRLSADVTSVAIGIEVEDGVDYLTVQNCKFDVVTTGTDEFTAAIHFVNDNTGCVVQNNYFSQGLAAAVAAIHMDADTDNLQILNNRVEGDYSTACIVGDTTLSTKLLIQGNLLMNGIPSNIGTEPAIELLTGTEAIIADNYIVCNLATKAAAIVADTALLFENYYNEDLTGTGGLIGTVSADD
jgi:hypothetical protein